MIITKQHLEDLIQRLNDSAELERCHSEVKKMLEIEEELLWWSQSGKCCRWQAADYFTSNIHLLKEALNALGKGNTSQAASLLQEYVSELNEAGERTIHF